MCGCTVYRNRSMQKKGYRVHIRLMKDRAVVFASNEAMGILFVLVDPPRIQEVQSAALMAMRSGKSPGIDGILIELIRRCNCSAIEETVKLLNKSGSRSNFPKTGVKVPSTTSTKGRAARIAL